MDVTIQAAVDGEADEAELRSLRDWLQAEQPRPARAEVVGEAPRAGEMGAVTDLLQVVVEHPELVGTLAGSVTTWLSTRRRSLKLRIRRADGAELEVDTSVKDPEAALQRLLEAAAEV